MASRCSQSWSAERSTPDCTRARLLMATAGEYLSVCWPERRSQVLTVPSAEQECKRLGSPAAAAIISWMVPECPDNLPAGCRLLLPRWYSMMLSFVRLAAKCLLSGLQAAFADLSAEPGAHNYGMMSLQTLSAAAWGSCHARPALYGLGTIVQMPARLLMAGLVPCEPQPPHCHCLPQSGDASGSCWWHQTIADLLTFFMPAYLTTHPADRLPWQRLHFL